MIVTETVNGLEGRFTDFANVIYKEQEDRKMKKDEDTYFLPREAR